MENTVNDLVDLKGWRKPGEELPYLQGALLADLHNSKRANSVMNIVILIIIPLCVNGIISILSFLLNEYYILNILELLFFVVICAVLVIVCIFSIKGFYRSLFPKEGIYKSLIKNGDFTVCDAVIKDIHYIHRQDSVDTMMANLADKEGIYCKKAIQCDWKRWLKIGSHVYLTCYEIDFGSYCFKIYPSIENGENAKAGAYGLDLYHKYIMSVVDIGSIINVLT
jgi:hypothetical protein